MSNSNTYPVLHADWLSSNVRRLIIKAPHVVKHARAGQFVIVRADDAGERIPLTIAGSSRADGTITLIIQAIGATTTLLCQKAPGDFLADVVGPLGKPTHIPPNTRHIVLVGGGVGTAVIYPQAAALKSGADALVGKSAGGVTPDSRLKTQDSAPSTQSSVLSPQSSHPPRISAIIGGRTRDLVILEKELAQACDAVYPCTDDGSYGFKGFVTDRLKLLIAESAPPPSEPPASKIPVDLVITAGPVPMMRAVADLTRGNNGSPHIPTVASLNPIMVDGTGMCGGCRVQLGKDMKFACVDGPEFDAHLVDFRELTDRLSAYRDMEKAALDRHQCKMNSP